MFPFQGCELLAKNQVFKKECATSAEKPKDRIYQEHERVCHARVLSHFACGRQRRMLLKSQAGRILANDTSDDYDREYHLPRLLRDHTPMVFVASHPDGTE